MRRKVRERLAKLGIGPISAQTQTPDAPAQSKESAVPRLDIEVIANGDFISMKEIAKKLKCSTRHAKRQFEEVPDLIKTGVTARVVPWSVWLQFLQARRVVGTRD